MNNTRRKAISKLTEQLEDIKGQIEELQSEEQDSFNNMPEGLQQSERGEASEAADNALQEVVDNLESAISSLEEAGI